MSRLTLFKPNCYENYVSNRNPPDTAFFVVYSLCCVFGLVLNAFLFYAYLFGPKTLLGNRKTFVLIMKMYTICDFLLALFLIPPIVLVSFGPYEKNIVWDIYIPIRNILLNLITVLLLALAFDRLMAAMAPTTKIWNQTLVCVLLLIPWTGGLILEIYFFIITYTKYPCSYKYSILKIYSNYYSYQTIIVLGLFLVIYPVTFGKVVYQLNSMKANGQDKKIQIIKDNLRFTFVILALTIIIIWALLPFFLSNFGIVQNLSYLLYYSYYFISPIDPIIFMATNRNFRKNFGKLIKFNKFK